MASTISDKMIATKSVTEDLANGEMKTHNFEITLLLL